MVKPAGTPTQPDGDIWGLRARPSSFSARTASPTHKGPKPLPSCSGCRVPGALQPPCHELKELSGDRQAERAKCTEGACFKNNFKKPARNIAGTGGEGTFGMILPPTFVGTP